MSEPQFTAEETAAKQALVKATEYLVNAYTDMLTHHGQVDVGNLAATIQLLVPQMDALAQVLIDAQLITRVAYWEMCAAKMKAAEKGIRATILATPRIIQAGPGAIPPKGN
jgi:hypothetical protein